MEDKTTRELLAEIVQLLQPVSDLSVEIVTQADIQSYTERLYNQLVALACDGITFLKEAREGQIITYAWIEKRDEFVRRAEKLIIDAPETLIE